MHDHGAGDRENPPAVGRTRHAIGGRGEHFLHKMEGETGANISACYQCERCTNSCPVSRFMDVKPHQVIRYIQLGRRERLLSSSTVWVCLSCEMCTTYCPNDVGVAETIQHLRKMAARSSIQPRELQLATFHQTFIEELQRFGRVNEFWLMGALNLKPGILKDKIRTGALKEEIELGLTLWRRGKLNLIPHRCKAVKEIRSLVENRNEENR